MSRAALMTSAMAGWLYLIDKLFNELLRDDHVEDFELGALVQVSVGTTFAA